MGKSKKKIFDYHKPEILWKYLDASGRIKSRKKTGLTELEQREMKKAVDRARQLALLPLPTRKQNRVVVKGSCQG